MEVQKLAAGLKILSDFPAKEVVLESGSMTVKGVKNLFCKEYIQKLEVLGFKAKLIEAKKDEFDKVVYKVEDWSYPAKKEEQPKLTFKTGLKSKKLTGDKEG